MNEGKKDVLKSKVLELLLDSIWYIRNDHVPLVKQRLIHALREIEEANG